MAKKKKKETNYKRLRVFNLVMAFFHAIQGVLMYVLSNDFSLPVTTSFLKFVPLINKLVPFTEIVYEVRIGPLVAAFLFMSAAAHLLVGLPGCSNQYIENIRKGINPMRWIEYSFSSSVMIVVIAMLVGMYDGISLIFIFGLNACMIMFGWMMELHNQSTKKVNWTAYIFGCIAGIVPWVAIALYLAGSINGDQGPPNFVYWIFFSIFIFFNSFAINMILQYKKVGPWKNYAFGEMMYIVLSLVAKSLLAWQVFAGTLRPV